MAVPLLLHARHQTPATTYETVGPWVVPWRFHSFEAEYEALTRRAGLVDISTQALIEVRGRDRASFLHQLLTNDIKRLAPGQGCRAALLDPSARFLAEFLVLADADAIWLLCDALRAHDVAHTLERYHFSEDVTIVNHERRDALLALEGPAAEEAVSRALGRSLALPQACDHITATLLGVPVRCIRRSLAGGSGVLCLVRAKEARGLWELLRASGEPAGLALAGWEALLTVRIERGVPWFGIDMDETNLLPEAGLEGELANDTKGCYVGQEIVARLQTYGSVNKKLVGLSLEGRDAPEPGERVVRGEEDIGHVTSGCWSPALQRPIAMGYVKRGAYEPGTRVDIVRGSARLVATVASRPLVPHR